jgi:hypothetical protein
MRRTSSLCLVNGVAAWDAGVSQSTYAGGPAPRTATLRPYMSLEPSIHCAFPAGQDDRVSEVMREHGNRVAPPV